MSVCTIIWCIVGAMFALYGCAAAIATLLSRLLFPRHQRIWAVVPLRGRVDNPEALLHCSSVSRLYERGFHHIWYIDAGMDNESKTRCRQLTEQGRFPQVLVPEEFAELLQFSSECAIL